MARSKNPNREKAFQIWSEHGGNITNRQIAELLGEKEKTISAWKCRDKWNVVLHKEECSTTEGKCSTTNNDQPESFSGQCEAIGHKSGERCKNKAVEGEKFCHFHLDGYRKDQCTANSRQTGERCKRKAEPGRTTCKFHGGRSNGPKGHQNNIKHGFFAKIFPDDEETRAIVSEIMEKSPLDILWEQIVIQYTAIARAQKIMFVTSKDEMIKELKKVKSERDVNPRHNPNNPDSEPFNETFREEEYEFQFAWDRQATLLNAQSKAMKTLDSLISRYEDLIEKNELKGLVVEEHRLRVDKLKAEITKITNVEDDKPIEILIKRKGEG